MNEQEEGRFIEFKAYSEQVIFVTESLTLRETLAIKINEWMQKCKDGLNKWKGSRK